jgi:predicted RNA methylase
MTPREISEAVAAGHYVAEREFDRYLPEGLRQLSALHWTPLKVAAYGARWLHARGVRSVIDVGSGAGKFCVVAALACDLSVTGLEQRERLVDVARSLARLYRVADRVTFVQGVYVGAPLPPADAYYLFNPFGENILNGDEHIDHAVELSDHRYLCDVAAMEQTLRDAPRGAHVMMYNGFGGAVPDTWEEVRPQADVPDLLSLWQKVR